MRASSRRPASACSISGGGITGGGFLYLDPDKGEYAGGLELQFQEFIHIKAVGILNTKMPDGSDGFSLLVIITAEFTPIQLGFGFTLIGVGGLLGVNRTVAVRRSCGSACATARSTASCSRRTSSPTRRASSAT